MKSLKMEVLNDKALRPCGNPFNVKPVSITGFNNGVIGQYVFDTGIKFSLEDNMTLLITPLVPDIFIVGWNMVGSLQICVGTLSVHACKEEVFASVAIVEKKPLPIRFVEFAKEGGRLITGEPKKVKSEPPLCGTSGYCNNSFKCDECSGDIQKSHDCHNCGTRYKDMTNPCTTDCENRNKWTPKEVKDV